jgi:hypothetical protein
VKGIGKLGKEGRNCAWKEGKVGKPSFLHKAPWFVFSSFFLSSSPLSEF